MKTKAILLALLLFNNCSSATTIYLSYRKIFNVVWTEINAISDSEQKGAVYYNWILITEDAVKQVIDKYEADEVIDLDEYSNMDIDINPDVTNEIIKLMKAQNGQ